MADNYKDHPIGISGPADKHRLITKSDSAAVDPKPRALYVLTSGDLSIGDSLGTAITYPVTAGQILPFRATHVRATGTTATVVGWE